MLDDIRTVLLKRTDISSLELSALSSSEVDLLLERNYGRDFRVRYGLESQEESDRRLKDFQKIKNIPTKSQKELDDEFNKKEKAKERKIKKGDKK